MLLSPPKRSHWEPKSWVGNGIIESHKAEMDFSVNSCLAFLYWTRISTKHSRHRGSTRNVDSGIWQDRLQQPWDDSEISHESPTGLTPRGSYTILYKKLEQYVIHRMGKWWEMPSTCGLNFFEKSPTCSSVLFDPHLTHTAFGRNGATRALHRIFSASKHRLLASPNRTPVCTSGTLRFAPDKSYNWRKKKKIDKNRL